MSGRRLKPRLDGTKPASAGWFGSALLVLSTVLATDAGAAPLTRFEQVEVLGHCPAKHALVLAERTLDLPYRFDDVRLALRSPDALALAGQSDVVDAGLVQRFKREGLRPLYDAEVRERLAKTVDELERSGCSRGRAISPSADDALAVAFELDDASYALKVTVEGGRLVARLTRRNADGQGHTAEARRELPAYIEGKRTPKGFRPERLAQVVIFPEAGLLAAVIRTNDPPRYEVPAVDVVVTFRLDR